MSLAAPTPPPKGLNVTALYDLHLNHGGHMVAFAQYHMPLYYKTGTVKEHLHTRHKAGLFDVSHMGQILLTSNDNKASSVLEALAKLVPSPAAKLGPGQCQYTVFVNEDGGTVDDLLIEVLDEARVLLVVNASRKMVDADYLHTFLPKGIQCALLQNQALLALQGPRAVNVLQQILPGVQDLSFMTGKHLHWQGQEIWVTRTGYTGEDGFEISLPNVLAEKFAQTFLAQGDVMLAGLGARDTLRLEAGLPLYGQELDQNRTFLEAGMAWVMGTPRPSALGCLGHDQLEAQRQCPPKFKRVGLKMTAQAIARIGCDVLNIHRENIGKITSGAFSPSLDTPIAMGYIDRNFTEVGTKVFVMIRNVAQPAEISALPFVPYKYKRK